MATEIIDLSCMPCCGACDLGSLNPIIQDTLNDGLLIQDATPTRLVSFTVTNEANCGDDVATYPDWVVLSPRDNTHYQPFANGHYSVITNATGNDPGDPGYEQGFFESYNIYCRAKYDILVDIPSALTPITYEWVLEGAWGVTTLGGGDTTSGYVRISTSQGAAVNILGAGWITAAGSLTIHSVNPFHATATFTPLNWYPYSLQDTTCGVVTIEFLEL